jgi:hypothetical protein
MRPLIHSYKRYRTVSEYLNPALIIALMVS